MTFSTINQAAPVRMAQAALVRMAQWLAAALRNLVTVVGIATILFAAANLAAERYQIAHPDVVHDTFSQTISAGTPRSLEIYKQIFHTSSDKEALARALASPGFAMHPTLQFMTAPIHNDYFQVGLEGIRYEPGWDDRFVASLLDGHRPLVFVFGASTILGHGVAGNETLPYYLNRILSSSGDKVALNFGAQAHNQRLEIAKLIYLLKIGYRPKDVVFLDGLNDLLMPQSNMRLEDQVIYHGFSENRGEIAFTPGASLRTPNYARLFLESLPLYRVLMAYRRDGPLPQPHLDRDAFTEGFSFLEADYRFRHWAEVAEANRQFYARKIVEYYRSNLKLLQTLSAGYGFRLKVFYQPIEYIDPTNPFVLEAARSAPGYRYLVETAKVVRDNIARKELDMIDISDALDTLDTYRVIDIAHYSPAANKKLAERVAEVLEP
jgi:hypothetical protein